MVWYVWIAAISITVCGGVMAWWQWYLYRTLVSELRTLHATYMVLPETACADNSGHNEHGDETSFTMINRDHAYLTQEARSCMQHSSPEHMRSLMRREQRSNNMRRRYTGNRSVRQHTGFVMPLERRHFWISSLFGPRKKPSGQNGYHYGIDLAAHRGTPVYASSHGTVAYAGWYRGYGKVVLIDHGNGFKTRYAHLHDIYIKRGDYVVRGTRIAAVGDTGHVRKTGRDASHLHFEIEHNGRRKNPLYYVNME